jgi:hypothetical protein
VRPSPLRPRGQRGGRQSCGGCPTRAVEERTDDRIDGGLSRKRYATSECCGEAATTTEHPGGPVGGPLSARLGCAAQPTGLRVVSCGRPTRPYSTTAGRGRRPAAAAQLAPRPRGRGALARRARAGGGCGSAARSRRHTRRDVRVPGIGYQAQYPALTINHDSTMIRFICRYFVVSTPREGHASHARGRWFETSRAHWNIRCRHRHGRRRRRGCRVSTDAEASRADRAVANACS